MQAGQAGTRRPAFAGPQRDNDIDASQRDDAFREATPREVVDRIGNYTVPPSPSGVWRFNFHIRPSGLFLPDSAFRPVCFMLRTWAPSTLGARGDCYWVPNVRDIRYEGSVLYMQFLVSDLQANPYGQMARGTCELHIGHAVARFTGGRRLAYGESR